MIERQSADIAIKDPTGEEIFTVPITSDCRRRKKLMEEDCITIKFDSTEAKPMPVGSYVDDEIFGRFFLTEEQLPSWDKGIGGYTYDLRFDAWYKLWALKKNMLTTSVRQIRERAESSWTLTGNLEMHLREVYHNLLTLDFIQRQWIVTQDGKVTNIFCAKREYNQTLNRYEIKIYSKYRVEKHVFFRIQYDYEEDGNEYTSSPFVVIREGKDVSQPVKVNNNREEDEYTFDYFGENTPFLIDGILLAQDYYYDEDVHGDWLYIEEINPTTGATADKPYDEVMIRESGIDYNNTIYQFENREYTSVDKIKLAMGMSETGGYGWKFDEECATQEEINAQKDLEDDQKVVERTRTTEDYEEEENDFGNYFVIESSDIPMYQNALTIQYNGTDILSALKKIADTFECEYWVDIEDWVDIEHNSYPTFKVYFGKCETGEEKTISCKDYQESGETKPLNAENISVNLNQSDNADKFYIFGSENNIPYSYRKKLVAKCVKKFSKSGKSCMYLQVPNISKGYKGFIDGKWFSTESATSEADFLLNQGTTGVSYSLEERGESASFIARISSVVNLKRGEYEVKVDGEHLSLTEILKKIEVSLLASGEGSYQSDEESDGWHCSLFFGLIGTNRKIALASVFDSGRYQRGQAPGASITFKWNAGIGEFSPRAPQIVNAVNLESDSYQFGIWGYADTEWSSFTQCGGYVKRLFDEKLTLEGTNSGNTEVNVTHKEITYQVEFNPFNDVRPNYVSGDLNSEEMEYFACADSELYDKISVNDEVTIVDSGNIDIPTMYYTTDFDNEASLYRLGAKRLMLPENDDPANPDYISGEWVCYKGAILPLKYVNISDTKELKEAVILFDNIYPNGKLKVLKAIPEDKETKTDATGNVELYTWGWQQWHLRLAHAATGQKINFDEQYILSGYELGIRFLPYTDLTEQEKQTEPETDTNSGSRLAGMQFSVEFNKKKAPYTPSGITEYQKIENPTGNPHNNGYYEYANGEFVLTSDTTVVSGKTYYQNILIPTQEGQSITDGTVTYTKDDLNNVFSIVRNNDFGAKLPNDVLYPKEGDACCLINWDVRAMNSLGLITAAERELMNKGFEYANALKEGNATFTCDMMSNFFFDWFGEHIPINVKSQDGQNDLKAYVRDSADTKDILAYVKNDYDIYRMPDIGQKVKIIHEGLHNKERSTRILGMELKLDKPYDTPKLICGETDVYSRLKQLEKEITKLTN